MLVYKALGNYSTPMTLSIFFKFGSFLSFVLVWQLITSFLLAMSYIGDFKMSFLSVFNLWYNSEYSWLLITSHQTGASIFLLSLFIHAGRGLYYSSFKKVELWLNGFAILLLVMLAAFLSYVLPFSQMSFWSATVITNLLSTLPYGTNIVTWVWSGFLVGGPTISRFYALHFLIPFLVAVLAMIHIFLLHMTGSTKSSFYSPKIPFTPFYIHKDLYYIIFFMFLSSFLMFFFMSYIIESDNFIMANPMVTPHHIKPEWYYLFAYAILRSIPSKSMSVLALVLAIFFPVLIMFKKKLAPNILGIFAVNFALLTFLSGQNIEHPFTFLSQVFSLVYFMLCLF